MEKKLLSTGESKTVRAGAAAKTAAQAEMLYNRLFKRRRHLQKWARRTGVEAYRLYDRDIPEIPLVLDSYGDVLSGSLYRRPFEREAEEEERWLKAMKEAAAEALNIKTEHIFLRERKRHNTAAREEGDVQYGRLAERKVTRIVNEYGLHFRVNVSDYLDTGLFPDRRLFRALIRSEAEGRRVLNLFCYTGTVSAAAAFGGAALVDSVDISNTYLDWALENFTLNGMGNLKRGPAGNRSPALPGSAFNFIRADALLFIEEALRQKKLWDIIILDPPAFSNSKKMKGSFDLKRDHGGLLDSCLRLLAPGGTLYFSANVKGFKLDRAGFSAGQRGGLEILKIEDITEKLRDEDFKGKRIPAAWRFRRG